MEREELEKRLQALSIQQGHLGTLDVRDVVTMLELRDEKIEHLQWEVEELTLGEDI